MGPSAAQPSHADVVCNRAALIHAENRRLIASWLPHEKTQEFYHSDTAGDLEKEDDDSFTPVPELLGLGAPLPQYGQGILDANGLQTNKSTDQLRKRMLGKQLQRRNNEKTAALTPVRKGVQGEKSSGRLDEADVDDEEGRTAIAGKVGESLATKREATQATIQYSDSQELPEVIDSKNVSHEEFNRAKRRPSSYLDEILSSRSRKQKKRKKMDPKQ